MRGNKNSDKNPEERDNEKEITGEIINFID